MLNRLLFFGKSKAGVPQFKQYYKRSYATYKHFNNQTSRGGNVYQFAWTPKAKRNTVIAGVVLACVVISNIEEAPVSHRKRLMLTPLWVENKMAANAYDQVVNQYGRAILPDSHPITQRVKKVMYRLINASQDYVDPVTGKHLNLFADTKTHTLPKRAIGWKIHVIDDVDLTKNQTPNAFVIGDGKVFVFRSILKLTGNDDGLATVLAHELGHLLAHHQGEQMTKSPFYIAMSVLMMSLFNNNTLGQLAVSLTAQLPASRVMETEADYIGLMVMSRACYNPHEAPLFWKRMVDFEKSLGGSVPELLATHPSSQRRTDHILKWMPQAERLREYSDCSGLPDPMKMFKFGH
ncbi:hypothetical protein CANARDRAFT_200182 [[Candida] arabinofermentans NRRL YB-2248]|uniref:Peptidase M48 domain-containing protein n=1 Tax=[Candida] arabinofermentans NRRL YB-2248 TaxID=983967 RepID=A0A1E4SYX0_9ASCO|nr:hypothetical protein CANARDRAFT_200182 [[Candida] arabinofermentans NRRL YB-2248]